MLGLCYYVSKYLSKKINTSANSNNIKIIERVALGQDKSLVIANICQKYYLLSVASQSINILKELNDEDIVNIKNQTGQSFIHMLEKSIKTKSSKNTDETE